MESTSRGFSHSMGDAALGRETNQPLNAAPPTMAAPAMSTKCFDAR